MIENNKPRLEDATEEEVANAENQKLGFPIAGAIICGVLVLAIVVCIIVIAVLKSKTAWERRCFLQVY